MKLKDSFAYTGRFPIFRDRIVSKVLLSSDNPNCPRSTFVKAFWDTGASMCIVTEEVAKFLNLKPTGTMQLRGAFNSRKECTMSTARICIVLGAFQIPIDVAIDSIGSSEKDCDIVLGLNFIMKGDFAFTHDGEQPVFSFCYPPLGHPIDFTTIAPKIHSDPICNTVLNSDPDESAEYRLQKVIIDDLMENKE
ncbi:MAG: hypothetical protein HDS28_03855 [Bacteroides sp.]|nr:hypothetical protein [Bacteroides sp.]